MTGEIGMEATLIGQFTLGPAAGTEDVGVIAGVNGQLDLAKVAVAGHFGDPTKGQERCLDISLGGSAELRPSLVIITQLETAGLRTGLRRARPSPAA